MKPKGERKLLLVSKRDRDLEVTLPSPAGSGPICRPDDARRRHRPESRSMGTNSPYELVFSVAVVTLKAS